MEHVTIVHYTLSLSTQKTSLFGKKRPRNVPKTSPWFQNHRQERRTGGTLCCFGLVKVLPNRFRKAAWGSVDPKELTEEAIDSVLKTDALKAAMQDIENVSKNVLQTLSNVQNGDTDWTPLDGLRKGKLDEMDIIKAVTHVLSSEGWDTERIAETRMNWNDQVRTR